VLWNAASLSYFYQTFQLKRKTGIWESIRRCLYHIDCWCLVHFSSNKSCNRSYKGRLCFG
jgi:hypothetical protein